MGRAQPARAADNHGQLTNTTTTTTTQHHSTAHTTQRQRPPTEFGHGEQGRWMGRSLQGACVCFVFVREDGRVPPPLGSAADADITTLCYKHHININHINTNQQRASTCSRPSRRAWSRASAASSGTPSSCRASSCELGLLGLPGGDEGGGETAVSFALARLLREGERGGGQGKKRRYHHHQRPPSIHSTHHSIISPPAQGELVLPPRDALLVRKAL